MYCVYKHTVPNGKIYIGITMQNPLTRWANGHGYHRQPVFYNAILKYGWDNIKHEILYSDLTKEEAEQKEIELIAYYKSNQREFGYNLESGGNATKRLSEETKKKISASERGKKQTDEAREKMRAAAKYKQKAILCIETGIIYESLSVAEKMTGIPTGNITLAAHGKRPTAKGYHWAFVKNAEPSEILKEDFPLLTKDE